MKVGTKSVFFGAHCFLIHPFVLALAWWRLYGFPWDPRLWVAFFVHDLGYIGKPNMDGPEGERHPVLGARIMSRLFDWHESRGHRAEFGVMVGTGYPPDRPWVNLGTWGRFTLLHSRYLAKTFGLQPSRLCAADKLAIALTPAWLYLPMVKATGELAEYMAHARHRLVGNAQITGAERARLESESAADWFAGVQSYCRRWAYAHRDGAPDTWTSDARQRATVNDAGVWQ